MLLDPLVPSLPPINCVFSMVIQIERHNGFIQTEEMQSVVNAVEENKYDGSGSNF